ncbi:MAG: hypothetical protein WEA36_10760 [Balneolaceae bacterium]
MRTNQVAILSLVAILFSSCATTQPSDGSVEVLGHDFSEYNEKGFLFTPESYRGEYGSVGIVSVRVWPKIMPADGFEQIDGYERMSDDRGKKWHVEIINTADAIEQMYLKAQEMGADALTQFSARAVDRRHGGLRVDGIEISGFAIDRQ